MGEENVEEIAQEIEVFIMNHGLTGKDDYFMYHTTMALYYFYYMDALHAAEMIDDGEVFDETEVGIIIKNLQVAKNTFLYYKSSLAFDIYEFDVNETITMDGCVLEKGHIMGNQENARRTARKWFHRFKNKYANRKGISSEEMMDKSISQDFFLYEVSLYILFLLGEDIDYSFVHG